MSHREGRSIGLALLLAAGVLAAVVTAVLLLSPTGVVADPCAFGVTPADRHEDSTDTACNATEHDDETLHPRTVLTPAEGPRGTTFRLRGWGYPEGTVTFFDADPSDPNTVGDNIIARHDTDDGRFDVNLRAGGEPGSGNYMVTVKDSEGEVASATFDITPAMSFEPATAVIGEELTINISDWDQLDEIGQQGAAFVRIGGVNVPIARRHVFNGTPCVAGIPGVENGLVSFDITVPPSVLTGLQTVSVYHEGQLTGSGDRCTSGQDEVPDSMEAVELQANADRVISRILRVLAEPDESTSAPISQSVDVDGGRDRRLEFKATVPGDLENIGDSIVIEFEPSFDLPDPSPPAQQVTIYKGEPIASSPKSNPSRAIVNGKVLTLNGATNFTGDSLRAGSTSQSSSRRARASKHPRRHGAPILPEAISARKTQRETKGTRSKFLSLMGHPGTRLRHRTRITWWSRIP